MVTARLPRVPRQLALQGVIPDTGPDDKSSSRIPKKKPDRSRAWVASLITPSWNQVVGILIDWEGLRRLAA